jgi:hypothetical protein
LAQDAKVIQGRLIDSKTGAPVPFATVRIMNGKSLIGGVVSNGDGGFQFPLRYHSSMNAVFITCIGYGNVQMRMSELQEGKINTIKLKESSTQLHEVVITSKRSNLSANKIVRLAVANLPKNYPAHPFSYLAYYRDYQKEEKDYVNLNEALVGVFDQGFQTNDLASTKIKLYQYRQNLNFKTDSLTALAYDNNNAGGNKFIPTATVSSFGGNELSILRVHDALRNNQETSFSFVNVFKNDFVRNHKFELLKTVYLDEKPLYHISFESLYFVTKGSHFAKGEIFIEPETYAIHKFIYSTYLREYHEEKLLYKIQIEYARANSKMYLNYISFNNFFKSKSNEGLLVTDVVYDRTINAFVVTFNHPPLRESATQKSNYDFRFDNSPMLIGDVERSERYSNQFKIYIANARDFNLGVKPEELKKRFSADFNSIRDAEGNVVNEVKYKMVSQFRELFIQKLDTVSSPSHQQGVFVVKNAALRTSPVDTTDLANASHYWMNSPLRNNLEPETKQSAADSLSQPQAERQLAKKPYELIQTGERNISFLEEKVYMQTDKPYYHPGQRIWYKAYLNYRIPFWRDSLSKVLYIELMNQEGKPIFSRTTRIENGIAFGDISLPPSLPPAHYFLRAYTHWMCNFDEKNFFIKPIPVYSLEEQPEGNPMDTTRGPVSTELALTVSKTTYKPREEVKLDIELSDQHGNPLGANLSVTVTDVFQVTPFRWEKNIIKDYPLDSARSWIKADSLLKPIEFGISVRGKFITKKAKDLPAKLMVIQSRKKKMEDFFSINTDSKGRFWVTGFQFYDSADIGFKVDNAKKLAGKFEWMPREIPPVATLSADSIPNVRARGKNQYPEFLFDREKNATLLNEVVVEATRIKEMPSDPTYGRPDISISSDDVARYNKIYDALLLRVPGFGAIGGLSNRGDPPLLIMDGTILSTASPSGLKTFKTFLNALEDISPFMVERIDVFKFGGAAFYGISGANGVVIIHTKTTEYKPKVQDGTIDQDAFQVFRVNGYSPTVTFVSPDYSKKEISMQPDYRSTILWQPEVKLAEGEGKATLHFFTADLPGRYRIVVEGVTTDFKPVRNVMFIEVDDSVK